MHHLAYFLESVNVMLPTEQEVRVSVSSAGFVRVGSRFEVLGRIALRLSRPRENWGKGKEPLLPIFLGEKSE